MVYERLYRNNEAKEKIWVDISVELGLPVSDCKTAWKSLRDQYGKYLKDAKTLSGQAYVDRKPYKYSEQLGFLRDSLQPRKTTGNYDDAVDAIEELREIFTEKETIPEEAFDETPKAGPSTSRLSRSPTPGKKRRRESDEEYSHFLDRLIAINEKTTEETKKDGPHKFFESLADTVSTFNLTPLELMTFQNKVYNYSLQLLSELKK